MLAAVCLHDDLYDNLHDDHSAREHNINQQHDHDGRSDDDLGKHYFDIVTADFVLNDDDQRTVHHLLQHDDDGSAQEGLGLQVRRDTGS